MGAIQRLGRRLGHSPLFAKVMKRIAPPIDRVVSRLTGGKRTVAGSILPTLILVHRGARSGKEYRTPLSYIRIGDGFGLAGSNWGQSHNPAWSYNLLAHPEVEVVVDGETVPVRARWLSTAEKAEVWPRFLEMWPAYDTYETRSGDRDIKVFVLERR